MLSVIIVLEAEEGVEISVFCSLCKLKVLHFISLTCVSCELCVSTALASTFEGVLRTGVTLYSPLLPCQNVPSPDDIIRTLIQRV